MGNKLDDETFSAVIFAVIIAVAVLVAAVVSFEYVGNSVRDYTGVKKYAALIFGTLLMTPLFTVPVLLLICGSLLAIAAPIFIVSEAVRLLWPLIKNKSKTNFGLRSRGCEVAMRKFIIKLFDVAFEENPSYKGIVVVSDSLEYDEAQPLPSVGDEVCAPSYDGRMIVIRRKFSYCEKVTQVELFCRICEE